jgi:hypothetical protein
MFQTGGIYTGVTPPPPLIVNNIVKKLCGINSCLIITPDQCIRLLSEPNIFYHNNQFIPQLQHFIRKGSSKG